MRVTPIQKWQDRKHAVTGPSVLIKSTRFPFYGWRDGLHSPTLSNMDCLSVCLRSTDNLVDGWFVVSGKDEVPDECVVGVTKAT
jgi:hypothetical protein